MRDPSVQINTRPLFEEEVDEAGVINLNKDRMNIGFAFRNLKDGTYIPLTEEFETEFLGRSSATVADSQPSSSCKGLFADVDELTDELENLLDVGSCFDPATSTIQGNLYFLENLQYLKTKLRRS